MEPRSLEVFVNIAFRCLNYDRNQRPTMDEIVKELKIALEHQLDTLISSLSEVGPRTTLLGSKTDGPLFYFRLASNQKLRKIKITCSLWIHSLTFEVEDSNGFLHSSRRYGGDYDRAHTIPPSQTKAIDLDVEEEITAIGGSYGRGLDIFFTLAFWTNKKKVYGPFGDKTRSDTLNSFKRSWDAGSFDGFYGRCGQYLEALGCCLKER
ncbi:agglutinin-like [Bidens hawaiensis]|uniref:agglutinin-like n=1 Tax=Bidens hawaiensis TaxID=980011 RepID=UPI004049618A